MDKSSLIMDEFHIIYHEKDELVSENSKIIETYYYDTVNPLSGSNVIEPLISSMLETTTDCDDDETNHDSIVSPIPNSTLKCETNNELSNEEKVCIDIMEMKRMMDEFNNTTLDLKNKIQQLEEEKKCLKEKNKKLKINMGEIENKLSFVFKNMMMKTKTEPTKLKILQPSVWVKANKFELSDYDEMHLEYMRYRNSVIRDQNPTKNHFMPEL